MDPTVLAAIITVIGGLLTTLVVTFLSGRQTPEPTPVPPTAIVFTATVPPTAVPTDSVPAGEPTSTPEPPTNTPEPTPTFTFTPIPPVALGEDWGQDCVSTLWQPSPANYTPTQGTNGCWQSLDFFAASRGSLLFLNERSGIGDPEIIGLFAPLPVTGSVTVKVRLKDLTNVDIMMGVFGEQNPESDGLLITIPAGDPNNRLLVQKNPADYETLKQTVTLQQGSGYEVTFSFDAVSVSAVVQPKVLTISGVPNNRPQKWLFLGFKGLKNGYRVQGEFVSLVVK